jgi:TRAP-type C4-dicarboxylate transport system permease small subunit
MMLTARFYTVYDREMSAPVSSQPPESEKAAEVAQPSPLLVRAVIQTSAAILRVERFAIVFLMALLLGLILLNVVTRYSGASIYWIDESAVFSVVWLTFIGGSAMARLRLDFAMTMLTDKLSPDWTRRAKVAAGFCVVGFAAALAAMCWFWFDPVGIAQAEFNAKRFAAASFNFIYTERTQTLNWPSWVLYIVIPMFSVTLFVHALANVLEDLRLADTANFPAFKLGNSQGIN